MEHPPLTLSFAELADVLGRRSQGLLDSQACTLPLAPLALPSGAMGCLHLSAWPALQTALHQQGIAAQGPTVDPDARPVPQAGARRGGPSLRLQLLFEPSSVGPYTTGWDLRVQPRLVEHLASAGLRFTGTSANRTDLGAGKPLPRG